MECLRGYITAKYDDIVKAFGKPNVFGPNARNEDKGVTCEWRIEYKDGVVATIYDWKHYGNTATDAYEWNIGGNSPMALERITAKLETPAP